MVAAKSPRRSCEETRFSSRLPRAPLVVMPNIAFPTPPASRTPGTPCGANPTGRVAIRASRPSLIDLRFKGDPWVVEREDGVAVCLGDYNLTELTASPLDLPSLNRWLQQLRLGQARRNYLRRIRKVSCE